MTLGQAKSKFRLKIQIFKVPLPLHKEKKKIFGKTLTFIVRYPIFVSFSQIFFEGEEGFAENKQGRDTVQNFGLWRKKLCLLRTPGTMPTGAFSQKTYREKAGFQNHQEGKAESFTNGVYASCTVAHVLLI